MRRSLWQISVDWFCLAKRVAEIVIGPVAGFQFVWLLFWRYFDMDDVLNDLWTNFNSFQKTYASLELRNNRF